MSSDVSNGIFRFPSFSHRPGRSAPPRSRRRPGRPSQLLVLASSQHSYHLPQPRPASRVVWQIVQPFSLPESVNDANRLTTAKRLPSRHDDVAVTRLDLSSKTGAAGTLGCDQG